MRIGITLTSSLHVGDEFIDLTKEVATKLAEHEHGLVFGGTDYGMMGTLATTYKEHNGIDLVGVMARDLVEVTKGYKVFDHLNETIWCDTIGGRKETIIKKSDGFLILPGGYGTIEELGDIFGAKVNKLIDKPIAIYNHNGFYDTLLTFFDELHAKQFSKVSYKEVVYVSKSFDDILQHYYSYTSVEISDKFVE